MASNSDFYSGGSATNRRAPPLPPKPAATLAATERRTAARSRQTTTASTRPTGGAAPSGAANSTSSRNSVMNNPTPHSGARKAPVASRPVGSYYNSTAPGGSASASGSSNNGAANPYASVVPAAVTSTAGPGPGIGPDATDNNNSNNNNNDTWDDWGSPAAKTSSTTAAAATNPHSSWAAPAASNTDPAPAAATNDWYSAGGAANTTTNNNNNNTARSGAAPAAYTSSGFGNQQSQQQQQQQPTQPMQPGNGFYQNNNNMQQDQQQQQPFLSGAMDSSAPTMSTMNSNSNGSINNSNSNAAHNAMPSFSMFMPSAPMQQQSQDPGAYLSPEDEAPLLEELGINIQHILLKTKAVVFPFSRFGGDQIDPTAICLDGDLPGPIAFLLLLGGEMVLTGKLQFGYIYIYGLFGCIAMTLVVNLISPTDAVSFWTVTSIMGYSLLPVNILALIKIFIINLIHLQTLGNILGGLTVLWSTVASTRLLELGCGLRSQRFLIAYPLLLFYSAFVMMTIL